MKLIYSFVLLVSVVSLTLQEKKAGTKSETQNKEVYSDITVKEWEKFKHFESEVSNSNLSEKNKETSLKQYAKDSLKILEVKLMAIKVLDEKKLLDQDIVENVVYYEVFLNQLKNSEIEPSNYLFFENKYNYIINYNLNKKVKRSNWLIVVLVSLVFILFLIIVRRWKTNQEISPQLSKQEKVVQTLILEGKSNKEIANELFISLSTVKTHITNIYNKLQVANRQELLQKSYN